MWLPFVLLYFYSTSLFLSLYRRLPPTSTSSRAQIRKFVSAMHTSEFFFEFHKNAACYRGSQLSFLTLTMLYY